MGDKTLPTTKIAEGLWIGELPPDNPDEYFVSHDYYGEYVNPQKQSKLTLYEPDEFAVNCNKVHAAISHLPADEKIAVLEECLYTERMIKSYDETDHEEEQRILDEFDASQELIRMVRETRNLNDQTTQSTDP